MSEHTVESLTDVHPTAGRLMSYSDLLKDPRWQRKRLEVLNRDDFKCTACSDRTKTLHVHHTYYVKGRKPWEYPADSLRTLCEDCHESVTEIMAEVQRLVGSMSKQSAETVLGFARAYESVQEPMDRISHVRVDSHDVAVGVASAIGINASEIADVAAGREDVAIDKLLDVMVGWAVTPHLKVKGCRIYLNEDGSNLIVDGNEYGRPLGDRHAMRNFELLMQLFTNIREAQHDG